QRIILNKPTVVEVITQPDMALHPNVAKVYERVTSNTERIGETFPAVIRDISVGGAFITGAALPLLSRISFSFELDDHGTVDAIAWALWRRDEDCEIPLSSGKTVTLPQGFGVLFEAIPIEARVAIHNLVVRQST
ncbi:MAG: PilZ domain-containing protein, partial [Myxococcota bacterium]